ncbi:NAD(P)/FAD-dependent oxidoreductase [Halorubrum sp. GN11_10-6_MGM]|uniref:NAD(P)/FAD-dependent oxidoreductase n=1 Tax=Halorubrum sp. GN11_10-6_MGM TaxID=2518112 RepID=UPI00130DB329|nr:NAD(P)/FAD-dependent oxidoreductase [Halorubrum sp. GN11_10-6_MGM]
MSDTSHGTYDAVVVGGGPAGATAAHALGSRGHDVLILDKSSFPRKKLCGGLVTWKTTQLLEREFGWNHESLGPEDGFEYSTPEYEVHFDGSTVKNGRSERPYYFADRRGYDAKLFEAAVSHETVDALEGAAVTDVDASTGVVSLADSSVVEGRYVVGADGAHSVVRNSLPGFDREAWGDNLAIATETFVPREAVDIDPDSLLVHLGFVNWGYGWVFPNRDRLVVGVGGLNRKNTDSFRTLLDRYFDRLGIDADASSAESRPIPFGNYLTEPTADRAMLVGDAAGFVDAMSGEGIFYAQRSGELCAHAIDRALGTGKSAPRLYTSYLDESVIPELRLSKLLRPLLWGGPSALRRPIIHTWGAALHRQWEELVHGTRLYRFLRKRGDPYHTTLP